MTADSISGEFESTEEFIKFANELKNAGADLQLEDSDGVQKYTAQQAIDNNLIFNVRYSSTTIEGSFEISEGIVKITQQPFKIGKSLSSGVFATAEDLFQFIEICLEDLRKFDQVQKRYSRQGYTIKNQVDYSERSLERNRNFWANPEKFLQGIENNRSRMFSKRIFNFGIR